MCLALRSAWPRARVYARTAAPRAGLRHKCVLFRACCSFSCAETSERPSFSPQRKKRQEGRGGSSLKNHRTVVLSRANALLSLSTFAGERGSRGVGYHRFAPPWRRLAPNRAKRARDRRETFPSIPKISHSLLALCSADCTRACGAVSVPSFPSSLNFNSVSLQSPTAARLSGGERTTEQDLRNVNDPSAGSPTETLLRLLLPLNDQVWSSSRQHRQCRDIAAHQSEDLTKSFNR